MTEKFLLLLHYPSGYVEIAGFEGEYAEVAKQAVDYVNRVHPNPRYKTKTLVSLNDYFEIARKHTVTVLASHPV